MSEFVPVSKADAVAAATAQAFTDDEGRTTVHSVLISGNLMLGADWDLAELLAEIETATELCWFDDPMGHDLALMSSTVGRAYKFEIKRPAEVES